MLLSGSLVPEKQVFLNKMGLFSSFGDIRHQLKVPLNLLIPAAVIFRQEMQWCVVWSKAPGVRSDVLRLVHWIDAWWSSPVQWRVAPVSLRQGWDEKGRFNSSINVEVLMRRLLGFLNENRPSWCSMHSSRGSNINRAATSFLTVFFLTSNVLGHPPE